MDHAYDPLAAIRQMLKVVKPQHALVLLHNINVGEKEGYDGLHQWNFCWQDGEFIIWNNDLRISVNKELSGIADVYLDECWNPEILIVSLIKR